MDYRNRLRNSIYKAPGHPLTRVLIISAIFCASVFYVHAAAIQTSIFGTGKTRIYRIINVLVTIILLGAISLGFLLWRRLKDNIAGLNAAKQELQAQNEVLRLAMEATHAGVWDYYPGQGTGYLSPQWHAMLGYDYHDVGLPLVEWRRYIHPEDLLAADKAFQEHLDAKSRGIFEIEFRVKRADGTWCWVLSKGRTVAWDEQGNPSRIIGLNLNIQNIKEVQERLAQSESKFRAIFESAPYAIVVNRLEDGTFLDANKAFLESHGIDKATLLELKSASYTSYSDKELAEALAILKDTGSIRDRDVAVKRPDGSIAYMIFSSEAIEVHGEKQIISITVDVTEQKRAEQALLENMERLRATLNLTTDGILVVNKEHQITQINRQFLEIWNVPNYLWAETDGLKMLEFLQEQVEDSARFLTDIHSLDQSRMDALEEIVLKDGRVLERHSSPMILNGKEIGRVWDFRDVTGRIRAEEAIRKSEQLFRGFVENATDIIFELTREGILAYVSPNWQDFMGEPAAAAVGKHFEHYVYPEDVPLLKEVLNSIVETGRKGVNADFRAYHCDGSLRWFSIKVSAQREAEGGRSGFIGIARDITDRKMMEEEKQSLQGQLLQAQKLEAIGVLAGGVAHDFNNILGVIVGYAELMLEEMEADNPLRDTVITMRDAGRHSVGLIRQLLAFARKQAATPVLFDLNEAVETILSMLSRLIGENIRLAWRPGTGPLMVDMDPSQLDQILANLCVNAKDAISDVGNITIETSAIECNETSGGFQGNISPGRYVQIIVKDDGCGMDRETVDHIYEPFYTTKAPGKGTGLGLATVYGIIRQNDGYIDVTSEPGKGTAFTIYIPRHAGAAATRASAIEEIPHSHGETLLIIEDDPSLLNLSRMMLEHLNYKVLAAATPGEAIHIVEKAEGMIDLFITDVIMPEMNGKVLAEQLQKIRPALKCIFMSGYTADVISHRGVLDKDTHFIQKPFSLKDLAIKIRAVLDG